MQLEVEPRDLFEVGHDNPQDAAGTKDPKAFADQPAAFFHIEVLQHMRMVDGIEAGVRTGQPAADVKCFGAGIG